MSPRLQSWRIALFIAGVNLAFLWPSSELSLLAHFRPWLVALLFASRSLAFLWIG